VVGILLGLVLLGHGEDFITDFEYGQMLYHDPRGASCAACHGETGAGEVIAEYPDSDGRRVLLHGPDIRRATEKQIRQSLRRGQGVMPRYFLTDQEIRAIHAYLRQVNRPKHTDIAQLFSQTPDTKPHTTTKTHEDNGSVDR